jgi:hypothetical protein
MRYGLIEKEIVSRPTDTAWKCCFIVNVALYPRHQVLDVLGSRHLCWSLKVFGVLPEVFESKTYQLILPE